MLMPKYWDEDGDVNAEDGMVVFVLVCRVVCCVCSVRRAECGG